MVRLFYANKRIFSSFGVLRAFIVRGFLGIEENSVLNSGPREVLSEDFFRLSSPSFYKVMYEKIGRIKCFLAFGHFREFILSVINFS